ncbi:hypothetical protein H2200_006696 [Cladophialophora chaetospira]|uniref:Uncharacterized protein n=1 Tax=Cladophialophora chaetospira TaxID=386627 RepID=A0AA39CHX6_9EURO|nr:hypothetical protein H2200_006696 [Cladophialophora chaetospira]
MSDSIFSQVRTKLRQSRSNTALRASTQTPTPSTNWDHVPSAFRPVERAGVRVVDGYYLNRPLPGPPPRPRTTSPPLDSEGRAMLNVGNIRNPAPRTHRTRSAEIAQRRWSGVSERDHDMQYKRASVNIAIALPPEHLDPPPPYSQYAGHHSTGHEPRPSSQPPPPTHTMHYVKPYDPSDYLLPHSRVEARAVEDVPLIAAPQPPTPVSPLNTLDLQYLTWEPQPASGSNVTIESLLTHPMLQHR